ncbi:MAG: hypothetical protein CVT97_08935 [Bacteroidetes bacterium HGW-Bacteroidetes-14]|nr:MAG: hypothetical protein CVT97_08935 [Bacteroidetes bacterium HGW-Bacteroidetes-14]
MFRQKLRIQQRFCYFFITIITAALADIVHIAPLKNPFNHEVCFGIVIKLLKIHIPKDAFFKYRFGFGFHGTKVVNKCMM